MKEDNQLLDELMWLNYQSGSLMVLCDDIINDKLNEGQLKWVLIQINTCISQIEETLQAQIPKPENQIKCPKCKGTEFLISEYASWEAKAVYSEIEKKWILEAYNNTNNGIDLIECKNCSKENFSEDYTSNFEMEVQFNG